MMTRERELLPLPEPHHQSAANFNAPDEPFYTADQMHAYAAAVSAAKDERIKVLEDALKSFTKSTYIRHQHPRRFAAAVAALGDKNG